ncbi:MAG: hypothetical protein ACJAWI_002317 [Marinomonas primoryensis]|jgi:hypothetical protein
MMYNGYAKGLALASPDERSERFEPVVMRLYGCVFFNVFV